MGKIIVSNFLSIDGLFSDANGSTPWVVDHPHPIETYLKQQLTEVDAIIFGANTYRMMAEYWPTSRSEHEDEVFKERMNNLPKVVFSSSLNHPEWNNTEVLRGIDKAEILHRKREARRPFIIFGSGTIVRQLMGLDLIDELRLFIMPVILGAGQSLFMGVERQELKLIEQRSFGREVELLRYAIHASD